MIFFKDSTQVESEFSMKFIPEDEIFAFTSPTSSHVKLEPNHNNLFRLDFKFTGELDTVTPSFQE